MAVVRAAMRSYGGPGLLSLYRGYWAGSLVWVPWNAVYLSVFGWLESRSGGDDADVATPASERGLAAGGRAAAASAVAALVTAPIDHVKTRLQVGVGGGGAGGGVDRGGVSLATAARSLLGEPGGAAQALVRGATARVLAVAPATAVAWAVYAPLSDKLRAEVGPGME